MKTKPNKKILKVPYDNQRDNISTPIAKGNSQCAYSSMAMFICFFSCQKISNKFIYNMIDDMEPQFGKPGFGEKITGRFAWYKNRRLGAYLEMIERYLNGKVGQIKRQTKGSIEQIKSIIDSGSPLILRTKLSKSGHYIVCVGYCDDGLIVNDPFGDHNADYTELNGKGIIYSWAKYNKYIATRGPQYVYRDQ